MSTHLGDPATHFFMTRSVARVMGVNLNEAMQEGDLPATTYADMVTRCRGCALVEACQTWLAHQTHISPTPPPGCCNAEMLSKLKAMH
jgi:hypothetical protein